MPAPDLHTAAGMTAGIADVSGRSAALVELQNVGKHYPANHDGASKVRVLMDLLLRGRTEHVFTALSGVDLNIRKGDSWGIIGENGAGKSTLLKIIAGVTRPTTGTCKVNGRVAAMLELGAGFHPEHSGRENIFLSAALHGWTRKETLDRMESVIAFADIGEHIDLPVRTYSTGMAVRLGFAIVSAMQPDLLITDEILAVGDESFQKKCMRWMEDYISGGGSLLLCSHSLYQIQSLCQHAIWLDHGRPRMAGEVFAVSQAYTTFHEEKSPASAHVARHLGPTHLSDQIARMTSLQLLDECGEPAHEFSLLDDITIRGQFSAPDDEPTIIMVGIVRADGTPVYGAFSSDAGFVPRRLDLRTFEFDFSLAECPLLPGKYRFKAHTLDRHGLRLFDTMEIEGVITGQTREHGFVRLNASWR